MSDSASTSAHRVRVVQGGDQARWLALRAALFPDLDPLHHEQCLRLALADPDRLPALVVERDSAEVVGFMECRVHTSDATVADVVALYVAPGSRGKGMGADLIARMEQLLARSGVERLRLDLERADTRTIDLLEGLQFGTSREIVRFERRVTAVTELARDADVSAVAVPADSVDAEVLLLTEIDEAAEARRRRRWIVNAVLGVIALVCVYHTDVFSPELVPGMLMPLLDLVFLIYFIGAFLAWRYGRRADTKQRMGELYGADRDRM